MKASVSHDFQKYYGAIENLYKKYWMKHLGIVGMLFCVLLVSVGIAPIVIKMLLIGTIGPLLVMETYRTIVKINNRQAFISQLEKYWESIIDTYNWISPDNIVYEDENNYYLKRGEEQIGISKKGSRTLPSQSRGLSLIIGENNRLFVKDDPIFVLYCDTTEIKHINLSKKNAKIIKDMKWRKLKNQVLRPILIGLIFLLIVLYIVGII